MWDEKLYVKEHGHWTTKGLGHRKGIYEGRQGILVPARKVWKIQRRRGTTAELESTVDDGSMKLSETQGMDNFNAIADQMVVPEFVGSSLEDCFKGSSARSSCSSTTASSRAVADAPEAKQQSPPSTSPAKPMNPFGTSFSFSEQPGPSVTTQRGASPQTTRRKKGIPITSPNGDAASPMTSRRVHKHILTDIVTPKRTAGSAAKLGRPDHGNVAIANEQLKKWSNCDDVYQVFFGDGFKQHKQFLQRNKGKLEVRMAATKERCSITFCIDRFRVTVDQLSCFYVIYYKYCVSCIDNKITPLEHTRFQICPHCCY